MSIYILMVVAALVALASLWVWCRLNQVSYGTMLMAQVAMLGIGFLVPVGTAFMGSLVPMWLLLSPALMWFTLAASLLLHIAYTRYQKGRAEHEAEEHARRVKMSDPDYIISQMSS